MKKDTWCQSERELDKCTFKPMNFVSKWKYINSWSKVWESTWNKYDEKEYQSTSQLFKTGNELVEDSILNWSKISNNLGGLDSKPRDLSAFIWQDDSILSGQESDQGFSVFNTNSKFKFQNTVWFGYSYKYLEKKKHSLI